MGISSEESNGKATQPGFQVEEMKEAKGRRTDFSSHRIDSEASRRLDGKRHELESRGWNLKRE